MDGGMSGRNEGRKEEMLVKTVVYFFHDENCFVILHRTSNWNGNRLLYLVILSWGIPYIPSYFSKTECRI